MINHFWGNKQEILNNKDYNFDFPDYGGLPTSTYSKLLAHHVDLIQTDLMYWLISAKTKSHFSKLFVRGLSNDTIKVSR